MSVRANWFLADLVGEESGAAVEEVGDPINLDGPASLNRRLIELVAEENRLWTGGLTCPIKDRPDTCCSACPVRERGTPRARLCSLGIAQEQALTALAVERSRAAES